MAMQGYVNIGSRFQHRGVDRVAGIVIGVVTFDHIAVEINLDQVAGTNLVEQQSVGIDQVLIRVARHPGA